KGGEYSGYRGAAGESARRDEPQHPEQDRLMDHVNHETVATQKPEPSRRVCERRERAPSSSREWLTQCDADEDEACPRRERNVVFGRRLVRREADPRQRAFVE